MSPDCSKALNKNKITPIDDLTSEKIEISPQRFIRVVHNSTQNAERNSTTTERGSKASTGSMENRDIDNIIAIFFIHGVGGCAELWNEQLRHFSKAGYVVVALDLLGHGESSSPREQAQYEFAELANDVMVVFDRFARKRNILVGHSYGASFCCLISSIRARRVSKVVLISGGAPIPLRPEPWSVFCLPIPLLTFIKPILLWSFERRAFYSKYRSKRRKLKAFSAPLHVIKAILLGQNWEAGDESFHNELMVPALLLHGAQDKFVSLEDEQWMQEAIYSSSLEVIQESGHMVMLESPEKVNWFIHNFLQRDPTTRSKVITSPSREVSKDSIHVKAKKSSSSGKRLSLAVESLSEYAIDNNPERSQSVSHLRRSSAVSLTVPGTSGVRSNSLPGSTIDITNTRKSKIKFEGVEIHITNDTSSQDENFVNQGYEKENDGTISKDYDKSSVDVVNQGYEKENGGTIPKDNVKRSVNDEKMVALSYNDVDSNISRSSSASSFKQRRKGMVKISTEPLPSVTK